MELENKSGIAPPLSDQSPGVTTPSEVSPLLRAHMIRLHPPGYSPPQIPYLNLQNSFRHVRKRAQRIQELEHGHL